MQRRTVRQAYELESVKLREQALVARATQMLAHDVRKPLQLIRAITFLVGEATEAEAKKMLEETLPEVEQALVSVEGMVEDVLSAHSELRLNRESVTVAELVAIVRKPLQSLFPDDFKRFKLDECSVNVPVNVDVRRMARVLSNIIVNAIEAAPKSAAIWVRAKADSRITELMVGNSGSFIPPEKRSLVFDEFYTSGKASGTGLGLAIAKRIVAAHGGSISVHSEQTDSCSGAGADVAMFTEFKIQLPSTCLSSQ